MIYPSLREIILFCVVVGICGVAWKFVKGYIDEPFRTLLIAVFVIGAALALLRLFGVL